MMRSGMNVFELGCFILCSFVSLLVIGPLVVHFKLGWAGWFVGLPLGFFGCFFCISALLWVVDVLFKGLRRIVQMLVGALRQR
jgi:hypothetical protein